MINMSSILDTQHYRIIKRLCSLAGFWPYQTRYKRRILHLLQLFILYLSSLPQIVRLYEAWNEDLDKMCMCLVPMLIIALCTAKIGTVSLFAVEMRTLLDQIQTEWEITRSKEEYKILVKYTGKSRKLCIMCTTGVCSAMFFSIVIPLSSPILDIVLPQNETRVKNLAFDLNYGIDQQRYWFWLWLQISIAIITATFIMVAVSCLYITHTIHGSYLFAIARHKLEQMIDVITKNASQSFKSNNYDMVYRNDENIRQKSKRQAMEIKKCVVSHRKAIGYTRSLHRIYTMYLFATVSFTICSTSITAIQLVSKLFRWTEMILPLSIMLNSSFQMYLLSLTAQAILDESSKIHEATFSSSWYKMPVKSWKDVMLIVTRSRIPCKLMVGKIFVISLESFRMIMQTSMSYFMLLASFR